MINKIKKLLELASDPGASPPEAETAGRMAARLMAKHQIDQAALDDHQFEASVDLAEAEARACRPGKKNAKEVPPWIGIIAFGVKVYTRTRTTRSIHAGYIMFQGPRTDAELAKWLHEYILAQCYKASEGMGLGQSNEFRNGYASAIQRRLKDLAAQRRDEEDHIPAHESTSLVIVKEKILDLMDKRFGPDKSRVKSTGVATSAQGYAAGMSAHLPTNRPLNESGQRRLK